MTTSPKTQRAAGIDPSAGAASGEPGSAAAPAAAARPMSAPGADPGPPDRLSSIQHIVVLMLENRSFDHMLGLL